MLSSDSASLVQRDGALPDLAMVLDSERFAEAMAVARPDLGVAGANLEYVRYKRATSCLVVQKLDTAVGVLLVYAKVFADPRGDKLAKARQEAAAPDGATRILGTSSVVVREFPADPKLPSLRGLEAADRVRHLVARALEKGPDPLADPTLDSAAVERLAYKPERRFVGRLDRRFVCKFYRHGAFARAFKAVKRLRSTDFFLVPEWVGRTQRHQLLLLRWIEGDPIREAIRGPRAMEDLADVGCAVAHYHRQPAKLAARTRQLEIGGLRVLAEQLGFLVPDLARPALELAQTLGTWLVTQDEPGTTIHGDLYDKQLLRVGERIAFLDVDEAVVGDPRDDLGNFVSHLERDGIAGTLDADVGPLAEALVDGYRDANQNALEGWRMYVAAGLLRLAHHPFRSGSSNWSAQSRRMIERAHEWAAPRRRRPATIPSTSVSGVDDRTQSPRVLCLNQDPGIDPKASKGAAAHLQAMRSAFAELGASVVPLDEPDNGRLRERLQTADRAGEVALIYERHSLASGLGAAYAKERGIPYVLEVNSPLSDEAARFRNFHESAADRQRDRTVFSRADAVIAVSKPVADYAVARGALRRRVHVWPNGVDGRLFRPREPGDELRSSLIPAGRFVVGFHGRLRPWHGFEFLADALRRLIEQGAPVHLLVVGEGDFEAAIADRVPASRRTLIGWQPFDTVARYVALFDALPLSYAPGEPFYFSPLKLAEAMACGVVPVVPDLPGLVSTVRDDVDGLVYPTGDWDALALAIERLVTHEADRSRLAAAARNKALSMGWDRIADFVLGYAK